MRIIINRTDAIGDTILTLPMARFLKDKIPNVHITFIVSSLCSELLKNNPDIDETWILNSKFSRIKQLFILMKKFKGQFCDAYFHVGGSFIPTLAAFLGRTKIRGGLLSRLPSFLLLNKGVAQHRSLVVMHESFYNLNLLEVIGQKFNYSDQSKYPPKIYITEQESQDAANNFLELLKKENKTFKEEYIVIHPGMTGHTLNWKSRNYARFIFQLEEKFPKRFLFVVSYTSSDEHYLKGFREELNLDQYGPIIERIIYFNGATKGLRNFMGILSKASLFLGPSTGPTHMANALGVKVVAVYSPIKAQSTSRWAPYNRSKTLTNLIVPDVVCGEERACAGASCPYYECMGKIEVSHVVEKAMSLLTVPEKTKE